MSSIVVIDSEATVSFTLYSWLDEIIETLLLVVPTQKGAKTIERYGELKPFYLQILRDGRLLYPGFDSEAKAVELITKKLIDEGYREFRIVREVLDPPKAVQSKLQLIYCYSNRIRKEAYFYYHNLVRVYVPYRK